MIEPGTAPDTIIFGSDWGVVWSARLVWATVNHACYQSGNDLHVKESKDVFMTQYEAVASAIGHWHKQADEAMKKLNYWHEELTKLPLPGKVATA